VPNRQQRAHRGRMVPRRRAAGLSPGTATVQPATVQPATVRPQPGAL